MFAFLHRRVAGIQWVVGTVVVANVLGWSPSFAAQGEADGLAFKAAGPEYAFDTGVLRGTLRKDGQSIGLKPVVHVPTGTNVISSFGLFSPYRLLTPNHRFADTAWSWSSRAKLLPDGTVEVEWAADKDHPFNMTGVYRFAAANIADFVVTVTPREDLRRFELFLASYFEAPDVFVYVRGNPATGEKSHFLEAKRADGFWHAFPRDEEVVSLVRDGRWKVRPHPVDWIIRPQLAAPLAFRRDPASKLTMVMMSSPRDCFMISTPFSGEAHRSIYLSLFGRDVRVGESATARVRLVVGRDLSERQVLDLYEAYVKDRQ